MKKDQDLEQAKYILSSSEYEKYKSWRDKPWAERYPYLANFLLITSFAIILILIGILL